MNNLALVRRKLNLTQTDLARCVGCSPITLSYLENGKRPVSADLALKIAQALQVPVSLLFPELGADRES